MDEDPVADRGQVVLEQAEIDAPPHAAHVHHGEVHGIGDQLDDPSGNGQAHGMLVLQPYLRATMSKVNFTSSFTFIMLPGTFTGLSL